MTSNQKEKITVLLSSCKIFSDVNEQELNRIVGEESELVTYCKGDAIFSRDSYRHAIGMIVSGQAQVIKDKMYLSTHKPGNIFGAVTLFGSNDYYATKIVALTSCEVLFISRETVSHLMAEDIRFSENYIAYLSDRVYFLNKRIDSLTAGSIEDKLMQYIKDNATNCGSKSITVRSYGTLAANLDSGRASLYRAMDSLTEKGIITREGKTIILLKE